MHIEKVSRYVPITTPTRSHDGSTVRQMLISIPKLKFLDDAIEDCVYYKKYKKPEEAVQFKPKDMERSASWCARLKGVPLSPQEAKVDALRAGMQPTEISKTLGIASSTVRGMIARIRAKKGE